MDKIRVATTRVARRAARSRPVRLLLGSGSPSRHEHASERGQGLAEYALILALIAIVSIVSLALLGGSITELFWDPINKEIGAVLRDVLGVT